VQDLRKLLEARRDSLADEWFADWDARLKNENLRPLWSGYRKERDEATRHFNKGADAMLELLMGVIEELEKYHGSPTIGLAAERALTALKLKLEPK
jgi:hypothetical protein